MTKFTKKINMPYLPVNVRWFMRGMKITAQGAISTAMLASCGWWLLGVHAETGWVAVGKFTMAVMALSIAMVNIYITGAGKRVNRREGA